MPGRTILILQVYLLTFLIATMSNATVLKPLCDKTDPCIVSAYEGDRVFTIEELRADLQQLWDFIAAEHPAAHAFTSEADFEALRGNIAAAIDQPMRVDQFHLLAAPLVSRLGCGHTRLITPEGFWDRHPDRFFPLQLRLLADGVHVLADHGGLSGIPRGSEILRIGGEPIGDLTASFREMVTTDGFNDTAARSRLGLYFAHFHAMTRGFPESVDVEWRAPGEEDVSSTYVRGISLEHLTAGQRTLAAADPDEDQHLDIDLLEDCPAGRMTIRSFGFYDRVEYFHAFIDSSMTMIRDAGLGQLILDLRGNDGGDPWCTVHLFSYLIGEPAPYFAEEYGPYAPLASPIDRAEHPFEGDLYILTDGECFSSTGHLGALLKHHGIGTFIGEETGGTYTCNDASHVVTLDNTGLRLNLPRYSFAAAVTGIERGCGLQPDHRVEATGADIAAGRDPVLEYAKALSAAAAN